MTTAVLLLGILLLVLGAELLVRGASRIALRFRVPRLVVGLSIVAFGTSAPELAVSTSAALSGQPDVALGNVVGSNTFNVLLVLGLSALLAPLRISARLIRIDVPVMIAVSGVLLAMAWNGLLGRIEGLTLLAGFAAYLVYLYRSGRSEASEADAETEDQRSPPTGASAALAWNIVFILSGIGLLVLGSRLLVASARDIATQLGVSELMIGLTVVAAGTSLPELATSVVAAARGERDIAVGNVVGSNIFNILAILGVAATIAPDGIAASPAAVTFDIPVMTAVAFLCLPVFFLRGEIARWEGAVFVGYYAAYTAYLALDATDHGALPEFGHAMLYFVIPLTVLTLVVIAPRGLRTRRRDG
jgi:cation:H+ antiporter